MKYIKYSYNTKVVNRNSFILHCSVFGFMATISSSIGNIKTQGTTITSAQKKTTTDTGGVRLSSGTIVAGPSQPKYGTTLTGPPSPTTTTTTSTRSSRGGGAATPSSEQALGAIAGSSGVAYQRGTPGDLIKYGVTGGEYSLQKTDTGKMVVGLTPGSYGYVGTLAPGEAVKKSAVGYEQPFSILTGKPTTREYLAPTQSRLLVG